MKIEHADLFYLSMPHVQDIADGSQDALVVRVQADGLTGWGECEASPLVSLANWNCPKSHLACKSVHDSVIGQHVDGPDDIVALGHHARRQGLDIAQTGHTLSGVEMALWDLLGKKISQPVYRLLGYDRAYPKTPYASQLFGDSPEQTARKASQSRQQGYRAVKFGWQNYGSGSVDEDRDHVAAARKGLGDDGVLLIDAGTVWGDDVSQAKARLPALDEFNVLWLEEPFVGEALAAYRELAAVSGNVGIAGGEGAFNFYMARHLIDHGDVGFIQIDTGRIGGIGPSKAVADYARTHGVTFVNHTFTTHLALSASLAPMAGVEEWTLCEYPVEPCDLAWELNREELSPGPDGLVRPPESPGLGVDVNLEAIRKYLVDVEIKVGGKCIYETPDI